jgi:Flp pilus assembly protein TadD
MVVWGMSDLFDRFRVAPKLRWALALGAIGAMAFFTLRQLNYWQDSVTLWSHAFEVTAGDLHVEKQLANAMVRENQYEAVAPHLVNIARLDPEDVSNHVNLGASYRREGRVQDAIQEFQTAIKLTDRGCLSNQDRRFRSVALVNLGSAYILLRDYRDALTSFQKLHQIEPGMVDHMIETYQGSAASAPTERIYENLALLLWSQGKAGEASSLLQEVVNQNPALDDTRALLAYLDARSK